MSKDEVIREAVGNPRPKAKKANTKSRKPAPRLVQLMNIIDEHTLAQVENTDLLVIEKLKSEFETVEDPRNQSYVKHKLSDVLIIVFLAVLARCNTWYDIELFGEMHEEFLTDILGLENGVPTDDTYRLVVSHINVNYVYGILVKLMLKFAEDVQKYGDPALVPETDILSFDGKKSRASGRKCTYSSPERKPLNTMSVYSANEGICLNQTFIHSKTNETPIMPVMIENMDINGAIVTADALNTQTATAEAIIKGGGKYVLPVQGNHKTLHGDMAVLFDENSRIDLEKPNCDYGGYKTDIEREHGGTTIRIYYITHRSVDCLYKADKWAGLSAAGMVRRIHRPNKPGEKITCDDRYYLLGGVNDIDTFERAARSHWGVENKLHWQLDYTMKDDANTTTTAGGAEGLQVFKKAGIPILQVFKAFFFRPYDSLNRVRAALDIGFERCIFRFLSVLDLDSLINENPKEFAVAENTTTIN